MRGSAWEEPGAAFQKCASGKSPYLKSTEQMCLQHFTWETSYFAGHLALVLKKKDIELSVGFTGPDSGTTENVVEGLIDAWNTGSATDFAGFFTEDADMVNSHGMHVRGRQAIAGLYAMLFHSVFARSSLHGSVASRRRLREDVELIHVKVNGTLYRGPSMVGEQNMMVSLVMTCHEKRWMVASMHNTLVSEGNG